MTITKACGPVAATAIYRARDPA